ncbi:C40 family peptidase [Actinoallomurus sp. NPDC052308]|uniref:C40 family peptidase n=1 Tax=Actinoallomurus sp. NPDC052308 TaxID=3155530 RepID=UPI0034358172
MKSTYHDRVPTGKAHLGAARPALLRYPVIGVSVLLAFWTPSGAAARTERGHTVMAASAPTHRQFRVLHAYERYLTRLAAQRVAARRAVRFAYRQMGKPYRFGGAGPRSYDCSGLAMAAWRKGGVSLPHRADIQYHLIRRKVPMRSLRPGDLVFFSGASHVGIYVGRGRFVHAPHTGTVIQRGSLTGWRRRAFAGAARPGAPAYRVWPRWVRTLAGRPRRKALGSVSVPARSAAWDGPVSVPRRGPAGAGGSASAPARSAAVPHGPGSAASRASDAAEPGGTGPAAPVGVPATMTAPAAAGDPRTTPGGSPGTPGGSQASGGSGSLDALRAALAGSAPTVG